MGTKSRLIIALLLVLGLSLVTAVPAATPALAAEQYEYYNTGDTAATPGGIYGARWRAQTFTPAVAHKITSVKLKLFRTGSPSTVTVSIKATDGGGHPTGADLCSGTINGNGLTNTSPGSWYEITLGAGYDLAASTQYAIVVRAPSGNLTNYVNWRYAGTPLIPSTYPGGCYEISNDGGSSWSAVTTSDFMFEEWGEPLDTTAPTVDIDVSDTLINEASVGGTFDVVATFNEAMDTVVTPTISFDPDVSASGTLTFASDAWSVGDTVYTATYDVADVNEEVADVDVSVGGAEDLAGNPQDPDPTTETDLFDVDTVAPTVGMSSTATDPTNISPIPMTATFSEDVNGFVEGDLTVGNGTASNFAGGPAIYTFDVTPVADGLVTVAIAGGVAQDAAGNDNTAAVQFSITYDSEAPTVVITSTATDPTNVSPIPMTATFSEDVTGFVEGDITVGNGTTSNFAGGPAVYTFDVTPTADGVVTVDIAAGVAQDAAGNDNTAATQFTIAYDSTGQTGGTTKDKYYTYEDVRVIASGFLPDSDVDVYVVNDTAWSDGQGIGPDVGDGMDTIHTDGSGDLGPVVIWSAPLEVGEYDIVFDAYQDGFYNELWDLVDHPNHPGFTVVSPPVGGEVHPINKAAVLAPWIGLAFVLILAVGSGTLALRRRRTQ